jgi:phenylpyruvate tautomerase PptA (4-oxalocrotonate tautomerase family)
MPTIIVKAPAGAFDAEARGRLAKALTAVAKTVEQGGDDPRHALVTWVLFDNFEPGRLYAGGADVQDRMIPVVVHFHYPAGVLDAAARTDAVRLVQEALAEAKAEDDGRPVMSSIIMAEVPDGAWGANGMLWWLPDFARVAGFKHLQHLVATEAA